MEEKPLCRDQCQFKREDECILQTCNFTFPIYGAACCEYLFDDEIQTYS